jgi:exopolysaccharide biosynthesis polyprenyl glycosylphosphotransferase
VGFIDDDPYKQHKIFYRSGFNSSDSLHVLGTRKDIPRLRKELDIDEIYVAISNNPHEALSNILDFLKKENIKAAFVPHLSKIFIHKLRISQIGQIPLVQEIEDELKTPYLYIKPYVDFFLSAIGLILFSPVFLIGAIGIKIDSDGPIFFTHDRVGKGGKIFKMYKFRTMFSDTDPYAVNPLEKNDPRITRLGVYLRKTSFDELPQIFNIIKGDMSFVGPRPEMPFIAAEYNELHRERLKVLPGITGLWQLSGDRKKAIHENMDYDLYYIRNMSFFLDIAILIETFVFAFRGI